MTPTHVKQVLIAARTSSEIQLVDVRSQEEHAVSVIAGAKLVPTVYESDAENNIEQAVLAATLTSAGTKAVIFYCATGQRACIAVRRGRGATFVHPTRCTTPVAPHLQAGRAHLRHLLSRSTIQAAALKAKLQGMHVSCMCGGAIGWYNEGFPVVDPAGRPVQALHPGSRRVLGYITEPNLFHLPKRGGIVTREKSSRPTSSTGQQH